MIKGLALLNEELRSKAYICHNEASWLRDDSLKVIDYCLKNNLAVIGYEIWIPKPGGPFIPQYEWDARPRKDNESWESYVLDINSQAIIEVMNFKWDKNDIRVLNEQPYFNLAIFTELEYKIL